MVMRPRLFRPPDLPSGAVSERSGRALVISAKSEPVWKRRPGEVGRYWTVGIPLRSLEEVDPAALGQGDVGLLPVGAPPLVPADAADLPELAARPHFLDLHLEEGLDRVTDLDLVGVRVDAEHDLVPLLVHQRPLLGDDRALHDVAGIHALPPRRPATASSAARVSTRWVCPSTSWTFSPAAASTFTCEWLRAVRWIAVYVWASLMWSQGLRKIQTD